MEIARFDPGSREPHAFVREEDVQLVLTADIEPRPDPAGLETLQAEAMRAPAQAPGSVVVRAGRPLRLLAVIHDLDRDPAWREEWIAEALDGIFREAHRRGLTRLAMPLPGTVHGRVPCGRALELLAAAIERAGTMRPQVLRIEDAPPGAVDALRASVKYAG